jgi:hypothetical protein
MWSTRESAALVAALAAGLMFAQPAAGYALAPAGIAVPSAGRARRQLALVRPAGRGSRTAGTCLGLRADAEEPADTFTGGNELALRILISQNRMARENHDRAYIPMDVAVRWARRLKLWSSKEQWEEWIEENKDKNPFIPPKPDEYYSARGVWLGWRYWLGEFE